MILDALLRSALLPALVAGVLLVVIRLVAGREGRTEARIWLEPISLAAGHAASQVALVGWPPFPPRDSTHGLFYIAIASALLSPVATAPGIRASVRRIATAILAFGVPLLLLRSRILQRWSTIEALLAVGAVGTGLLAIGSAARTAARLPGPLSFFVLLVPLGAAAGVLGLSGTALHSQLAGAVASGLGAGVVVSLGGSRAPVLTSSALTASTLLASVLITGHFYAGVSATNAFLLAFCPIVTAWLVGHERLGSLPKWQQTIAHALGPGILSAVALGLSLRAFLASDHGGF